MPHDIVIVTDALSAGLFALTDLSVRVVEPPVAEDVIRAEATDPQRRIVFVTETVAPPVERVFDLQQRAEAVIVLIPGCGATKNLGERMIDMLQESVIGHNGT
jgi:vacuolar-type H+-ATPase subunit F/Vma7